ncbi:MAG: Rpn family recombination-promoting nuclease/putative transposase [Treponema sp.]|nr:Rpn family recombination-promoting nuclease/putative transposase [Treponema sp.]
MAGKTTRILNPRLDPNFKAIFTQDTEDSRKALRSFLSAAIGREVSSATVVNSEIPKVYDAQRGINYDINCTFADGEKAQVEMQSWDEGYAYGKRAEYYAARLLSSVIDVGDDWDKIPQVYQISVLNFRFDKTNEQPIHHYIMCDRKDGAKLTERLNVIFMELPKIPKTEEITDANNLPPVIKWCKFLEEADNPSKQDFISNLAQTEEGMMAAENTLTKINMDEWRWIIQGQIEGKRRDYTSGLLAAERRGVAKGIEQGIVQGVQQNARENARNLLKMNLGTAEQIAQAVSLPLEEVLALKDELENGKLKTEI